MERRLRQIISTLYGDISYEELPRVMWLSAMLCGIIGGFWLLDSLKDTVLATTVGLEWQPKAKVASVVVTLFLVAAYNNLIRVVSKPTLFYVLGFTYACVFVVLGGLLSHDTIGMANTTPDPTRVIGWASYFAIESYGSLMVALFWAFTNATTDEATAKSAYGLVVAFAQLGAVGGSTLATQARSLHISFLYVLGGCSCLLVCAMVKGYETLFASEEAAVAPERKPTPSRFFDGLGLLRHSYVLLLLMISTLYEVVLTVLDFEMKVVGRARFGGDTRGAEEFARLMGQFGIAVNLTSFLFSLLCFSWVVRRLGVPGTLLVFPLLCVACTLVAYASPSMITLFAATAGLKALTYSLNEPALEMLYLPTSDDVKFKAKAWIDVVGARSAKAFGSAINDLVQNSPSLRTTLPQYGNVPTLIVSLVLLFVAVRMGQRFDEAVLAGETVGDPGADASRHRRAGYEMVRANDPWRRDLERLHSFEFDDDELDEDVSDTEYSEDPR